MGMTHHSSLRYGGGRAFCGHGSCAASGPVRVSYFDPATGEPTAHKVAPRRRKGNRKQFAPGVVPPGAIAVTVDGKAYESIADAARREGISLNTLRMARKMGWTRVGRHGVSFG